MTSKGQKLGGPKGEGRGFSQKLGHTNFVATEGWLSFWKARHQICTNGHMERREVQT